MARRWILAAFAAAAAAGGWALARHAPAIAASAFLHPFRRVTHMPTPASCRDVMFDGAGVRLRGWRCAPPGAPRGTVVYLPGIADNRASAYWAIRRLVPRGFEVIAYDGRAHGESEGQYCTYGFYEKLDLSSVLNTVHARPVALVGTSLGAAVALQAAAGDNRIAAVVAAETFSSLRSIARHRAPRLLTDSMIQQAFQAAERIARFKVDEVSPLAAAARIRIPVLLLHGEQDRETPPEHSRQVFAALSGPKQLIIVPGAKHDGALNPKTWPLVENWLDETLK